MTTPTSDRAAPRARARQRVLTALGCAAALSMTLPACSGATASALLGKDGGAGSSSGGSSGGGGGSSSGGSSGGGSGSSSGGTGSSSGGGDASVDDGGGCATSVHGTVWDPAKLHPVYNAIVYVPSAPLDPIATGPSCDPCGSPPSGKPLAVALSGPDGTFTLEGVPPGTDVPIVVQIGKWRREGALIPAVTACADTAVPDDLTRLPRSRGEGHLPRIAVSTGLDSMECALQSMGIDAAEFTDSTGPGRVHLYQGGATTGATAGAATASASTLWASAAVLDQYDMVLDACQGAAPTDKPQASLDNLVAYAAKGGRVYLSHYEDFVLWPTGETSPWSSTASQDVAMPSNQTASNIAIDLGFPKGNALAHWALGVGAATQLGNIATINNARADVLSVTPPSKGWLRGNVTGVAQTTNVYQYSFYAGASACGKVAYSDFHVSAGAQAVAAFPTECATAGPDPGATDLFEFFFLDALSCAQDDSIAPQPPPLK